MNRSESTSITSTAFSFRLTLMARHSRVNSSMMLSMRNLRPSWVRSSTKSYAHTGSVAISGYGRKSLRRFVFAYAASRSNCSARDGCSVQAYFACPFRIMWIISIPSRIARALLTDLKLSIGRVRRLMAR